MSTISAELLSAYRFHRGTYKPGQRQYSGLHAFECIARARADMAAGRKRYAESVWKKAAPAGLRFVGEANADDRGGIWADHSGRNGWYADNECGDINGVVKGVVFQLAGRKGTARFVAGYRFDAHDADGVTLDFGMIYESTESLPHTVKYGGSVYHGCYEENPCDHDAAREAARAADGMAQNAAEEEREYSAAWQAGQHYDYLGDEITEAKAEIIGLLSERKQARRAGSFEHSAYRAICAAIRSQVAGLLETVAEARAKREKLAAGDYVSDWLPGFDTRDSRLQAAFCEGGSLDSFPA